MATSGPSVPLRPPRMFEAQNQRRIVLHCLQPLRPPAKSALGPHGAAAPDAGWDAPVETLHVLLRVRIAARLGGFTARGLEGRRAVRIGIARAPV